MHSAACYTPSKLAALHRAFVHFSVFDRCYSPLRCRGEGVDGGGVGACGRIRCDRKHHIPVPKIVDNMGSSNYCICSFKELDRGELCVHARNTEHYLLSCVVSRSNLGRGLVHRAGVVKSGGGKGDDEFLCLFCP